MNPSNLAVWLRVLAAETANDVTDPWPDIRRKLLRTKRSRSANIARFPGRALVAGAVAVLVVGLGVGVTVLANQAETASAAEVLQTLRVEAATADPSPGLCGPPNASPPSAGGAIAINAGGNPNAPVTVSRSDATQVSDKLAQALGVSGDRVREAMRQTLSPEIPSSPPPDPVAGIARQLGLSTDQVCAAFSNPHPVVGMWSSSSPSVQYGGAGRSTVLVINGTAINLETETADQLSGPARKLGVSPERLLAAVKAAEPPPPALPSVPPNADELINRFAQHLGMSPDKVRAAITQVEGPNRFYFVLPLPGSGRSS